jgi:hypothetical protein
MNWRGLGIVVLVAAGATTGLAEAKHAVRKVPYSKAPIDGAWRANGVVTVAKHVSNATVGQHLSEQWTFKSRCKTKPKMTCKPAVMTYSAGAHTYHVQLKGTLKSWSGRLDNQTFECTAGGVATGSLVFKLRVTDFVVHAKRKVASAMTATGVESGTGCTKVKEVVNFTVRRTGF